MSELPIVSLTLGLAGACAIITIGTLLARMHWLNFLRFCGEHSIVIYLAFFLPMASTRTLLLKTGIIPDIGMISLIVTVVGVAGALLIWRAALAVHANFLFERPGCVLDRTAQGRPHAAGGGVVMRLAARVMPGACAGASTASHLGRDRWMALAARHRQNLGQSPPRLSIAAKLLKLRPCRNPRKKPLPPKPAAAKPAAKPVPAKAPRKAAGQGLRQGRPRLPGRRLLLHFPRLSRAAAAQPQIRRAAGQRRARLLQHAVEAAARHARGQPADASRHRLRQVRGHLPQQALSRLQGAPAAGARRSDSAIRA